MARCYGRLVVKMLGVGWVISKSQTERSTRWFKRLPFHLLNVIESPHSIKRVLVESRDCAERSPPANVAWVCFFV